MDANDIHGTIKELLVDVETHFEESQLVLAERKKRVVLCRTIITKKISRLM